jgi:hypothetical protein
MNKKGISNVVATVVMIGISISAIAILFPIIQDAIRGPMLSPAVSCSDMTNFQPIKIRDICYNTKEEIKIKLERTFDSIDIPSLTFSLSNNGKIRKWSCSENCNNCQILSPGETKYYYLTIRESISNAAVTLSAGECAIERQEITKPCVD